MNRSAVLTGVSASDVDLGFRVRTDKTTAGSAYFVYGIARRVSSTTEYRAHWLPTAASTSGAPRWSAGCRRCSAARSR